MLLSQTIISFPSPFPMISAEPGGLSMSSPLNVGDYETKAGKQHNVNLCDDEEQNEMPFGWYQSFSQRALGVRILNQGPYTKSSIIRSVRFITNEENSQKGKVYDWDWNQFGSPDQFNAFVTKYLPTFENYELKSDHWNGITDWIELLNYKYVLVEGVPCWRVYPDKKSQEYAAQRDKLNKAQMHFVTSFAAALKADMKNGLAKDLMQTALLHMIKVSDNIDFFDVKWMAPSVHCTTNTYVQNIYGGATHPSARMLFNAPFQVGAVCDEYYSSDHDVSDLSSLRYLSLDSASSHSDPGKTKEERYPKKPMKRVVPDFCVYLDKYPGVFPMVIELKPAGQEEEGFSQNREQMLSKLFFQDVIFGLVVSPRIFQMSFIIKRKKTLHFGTSGQLPLTITEDLEGSKSLNMNSLNALFTFYYRAVQWGIKSNCSLGTNSETETEK